MLKTLEDLSTTKKRLEIEIPADVIEKEIQSGLEAVRRRAKLPGYRQGKAPISLIEKRFGKDVEADVLEKVVPRAYAEAVREADLRPVSRPSLEGSLDLKRNAPLSMVLTVEVRPEIEGLDYEGTAIAGIPTDVDDSDVDSALARLQEKKTVYEPTDDAASEGYLVVMDYETREDGGQYKDQTYKVGQGIMPPGFAENITGMKKGEEKEFTVRFPEDFPSGDVAGKEVHFRVSVKEVKKPRLPDIDDELAKDVGFDDLDSIRKHIRDEIKASKEATARKIQKAEVVKRILDRHAFDAPETMIEAALQRLVAEAKGSGREEPDDKLREEFRAQAVEHARASILLETVGERENIEVSDAEARERVDALSRQIGMSPENVMKYYVSRDGSLDGLKSELFEDKVLDLLLEKAVIEKGDKK